MRYIGNKTKLLSFINQTMQKYQVRGDVFCDLFSGTGAVGNYFKSLGYKIISADFLYSSYVQQQVRIAINKMPSFELLGKYLNLASMDPHFGYAQAVVNYLNKLSGIEGFIYKNYSPDGTASLLIPRTYFLADNAKKLDAIRETVSFWRSADLINEEEFYILLYALLNEVSRINNTTGTQKSFLKKFKEGYATSPVRLILPTITSSEKAHNVIWGNSLDVINDIEPVDVLYLDPPYTRDQYAAAYHVSETIARGDTPSLRGICGYRDYSDQKSSFCSKVHALDALKHIVESKNYHHLLLSYSNEGILSHERILNLLSQYGDIAWEEVDYRRYLQKNPDPNRRFVKERLYYLKNSNYGSSGILAHHHSMPQPSYNIIH